MKKPGEFKKARSYRKVLQGIYDACRRARSGEPDVWVTVKAAHGPLVRVKLQPFDPKALTFGRWDYACEAGYGAIIMMNKAPVFIELAGKDGMVYGPTGSIPMNSFGKKALALIERREDVHSPLHTFRADL